MTLGCKVFTWKRTLHISVGVVFALYFLMLAVTGVMINHSTDWGLTERYVSRRYLPSDYRPLDGEESRLDIVITDLHSGRIFGVTGRWLPDVVAAFLAVSILSGVGMVLWRKARPETAQAGSADEPVVIDAQAEETPIEEPVNARD
jgi:hypothetical protein